MLVTYNCAAHSSCIFFPGEWIFIISILVISFKYCGF